jgi:hypothetical protein
MYLYTFVHDTYSAGPEYQGLAGTLACLTLSDIPLIQHAPILPVWNDSRSNHAGVTTMAEVSHISAIFD